MRHGNKNNHLGRTTSHRKAMLANMASSLILHKRITTTLAKAKVLRGYVEPLLTKSKNDTTHSRRTVFSYLQDKDATSILFREIAEKIANRPGGYTRIIKLENRLGDNAEMAIIELVDYNTVYGSDASAPAKKSTRRRGGTKAKTSNPVAAAAAVEVEEEIPNNQRDEKLTEPETKVKTSDNNVLDMSLIKESQHYVETVDPSVDAFRVYNLLSRYQETGKIKSTYNKSQIRLINEFDLLSAPEKEERLLGLKSQFSTVA